MSDRERERVERECLEATNSLLRDQGVSLVTTDELFRALLAQRVKGMLEAGVIAEAERNEYGELLKKGKGTWPQSGYVTDDAWSMWHGRLASADKIARKICTAADELEGE